MIMEISTSTYLSGWQFLSVTVVRSWFLFGADQERCSSSSFRFYHLQNVTCGRGNIYCLPNLECLPELVELLKKPQKSNVCSCFRQSQLGCAKRDAHGNAVVPL